MLIVDSGNQPPPTVPASSLLNADMRRWAARLHVPFVPNPAFSGAQHHPDARCTDAGQHASACTSDVARDVERSGWPIRPSSHRCSPADLDADAIMRGTQDDKISAPEGELRRSVVRGARLADVLRAAKCSSATTVISSARALQARVDSIRCPSVAPCGPPRQRGRCSQSPNRVAVVRALHRTKTPAPTLAQPEATMIATWRRSPECRTAARLVEAARQRHHRVSYHRDRGRQRQPGHVVRDRHTVDFARFRYSIRTAPKRRGITTS